MASDYMGDLSSVLGTTTSNKVATQSTNKKAGSDLDMTDFLTLMVAGFKNQDMENPASTTDMMNQLVQMSVVTAINNINSLISDSTVMTYAASLVGKTVTVGKIVPGVKGVQEIQGEVTGTGTLNGKQVIFLGEDSYYLTDIMAIGKLPEKKEDIDPDGTTTEGTGGSTDNSGSTEGAGSAGGTEGSGSSTGSGSTGEDDGLNPDGTPNIPSSI